MSVIYVQRGEQQVGPLTAEELAEKVEAGELSPEDLYWSEGMEEWQLLSTVIQIEIEPADGGETGEEDSDPAPVAEEADILHEIAGTTITNHSIYLESGAVLSLVDITKVRIETETVKRAKPITKCVLIGILVVGLIAGLVLAKFSLTSNIQWTILLVLFFLWLAYSWSRFLLQAIQVGASRVVIDLSDGDKRMIVAPLQSARQLSTAINTILSEIEREAAKEGEDEEEDSGPDFAGVRVEETEMEDSDPALEIPEGEILHQIAGTTITAQSVYLKSGGILSLMEIGRVSIQTRAVRSRQPIIGCGIIGILILGLIVSGAIGIIPLTDAFQWILFALFLGGLIALGGYFLRQVLRQEDSMVVIKLKRGDERLIGAPPETAQQLCDAISELLPEPLPDPEGDGEGDSGPDFTAESTEEAEKEVLDPTLSIPKGEILHKIADTAITARSVYMKSGAVLPINEIARVSIQAEAARSRQPVVACVILGILIIGLGVMKIRQPIDGNWFLWIFLLVVLGFVWSRFLKKALNKGDSMVVIKLKGGDERLIGAPYVAARQLRDAIDKLLPENSSKKQGKAGAQKMRYR